MALPLCMLLGVETAHQSLDKPVDRQGLNGWPELRVIDQPGYPNFMHAIDSNHDGKQELLVVNRRHSRLDWYRWQTTSELSEQQQESVATASSNSPSVNHLPLSPEFQHKEITLDHVPHDVLVMADQSFWLLSGPRLQLEHWQWQDSDQQWEVVSTIRLPTAQTNGRIPMQYVPESNKILIACEQGVMQVPLSSPAQAQGRQIQREQAERPSWVQPKRAQRLINWDMVDIDQDGIRDVLFQYSQGGDVPYWARHHANTLKPPQRLAWDSIGNYQLARGPQPWLVGIDPNQEQLVRSYQFSNNEPSKLGEASHFTYRTVLLDHDSDP